jgi:hypothetical protein
VTCILLFEEYGKTFEYLPGKKNVAADAGLLSSLDIDSLKIQENKEKEFTILSEWETSSIFKNLASVEKIGLIEKGLAQPQYSIQKGIWCALLQRWPKDLNPAIIGTDEKSTVLVWLLCTMSRGQSKFYDLF